MSRESNWSSQCSGSSRNRWESVIPAAWLDKRGGRMDRPAHGLQPAHTLAGVAIRRLHFQAGRPTGSTGLLNRTRIGRISSHPHPSTNLDIVDRSDQQPPIHTRFPLVRIPFRDRLTRYIHRTTHRLNFQTMDGGGRSNFSTATNQPVKPPTWNTLTPPIKTIRDAISWINRYTTSRPLSVNKTVGSLLERDGYISWRIS